MNSRDQTNSLEEDSNLDDLEDDDADEIEMDETKPEKAEETNVVTKDMAKEVQEQEPRLVLFVVHEEVHDVVFVEVSLMQHLKNILSRMRKETCSFFARLFSRRNPPAQIEETQNSRVYETSIDSEVESHQLPRLHAQTNERKENHHVDPSFDHTQNH